MSYSDFIGIVASGRQNVSTATENVMPAFSTTPNVMCYLDDIYVYLRARANNAIPRGRPQKHVDKPETAKKNEDQGMIHCFRREPAGHASGGTPGSGSERAGDDMRRWYRTLLQSRCSRIQLPEARARRARPQPIRSRERACRSS